MIPYREPTRQEITVLRRCFNRWGIFDYIVDKEILIREKKMHDSRIKEVLVTTKDNFETTKDNPSLCHVGLLIGQLRRKSFAPSMAGADLIARVSASFPFVIVNQVAESLVLYGRDIMNASIIEYGNLNKSDIVVIILNESRIAIGIGIAIAVPSAKNTRIFDKRIVVKTIMDAGYYLRNESNVGVEGDE